MDKSNLHIIEIGPNEKIKKTLEEYLIKNKIKRGYILSGIGSLSECKINNPIDQTLPVKVKTTNYKIPMELTSITGEFFPSEELDKNLKSVYKDCGQLFVHIHVSFAKNDSLVVGGGLVEGKVFREVKIIFIEII